MMKQGGFSGLVLPGRYRSLEHFIYSIEEALSSAIIDLIEADIPIEEVSRRLDPVFRVIYPVTQTTRWALHPEDGKKAIIFEMFDEFYHWTPSDDDLLLLEPSQIEESIAEMNRREV